jgi:hypothetical protein
MTSSPPRLRRTTRAPSRSSRADDLRQLFLRERDPDRRVFAAFEDVHEFEKTPPDPLLDRHVERIHQLDGEPPYLGDKGLDDHPVDGCVPRAELVELVSMDGECLDRIERERGRVPRSGRDDRELAEEVTRA